MWFLLGVLLVLAVGLFKPVLPLALVGLTLLAWFGFQWLAFLLRLPALRSLGVEREVWDEKAPVATLWAGQSFEVRVRVAASDRLSLPFAAVTDAQPYSVEHLSGPITAQGAISAREPLEFGYRIRCGAAGLARFEGVRIKVADWQGFFSHVHFVHAVVTFPILPVLTRRAGQPASKKRHNQLMPPGIHRFRRPGSGSELLDLRDYLPGDPPKTIAWKVSARRDRLITKEFESEVPVRCTLFVDTSNSVRVPGLAGVGPRQVNYGKALDRLIDLAAGILQANSGIRDLTGLCLFDEQNYTSVRPDRGSAHLSACLRMLAEAGALTPERGRANPEHLLPLASSFVREVYPELLRPSINSVPLWLVWMDGFPGYSHRLPLSLGELFFRRRAGGSRLELFDLLHRRKNELRGLCWWASFWSLMLPLFLFAARVFLKLRIPDSLVVSSLFFCSLASLGLWAGTAVLFAWDALAGTKRRRLDRWHKQLAAILSARYGLAPGGLSTLLEDDEAFSLYLQRFLSEYQVPYALPLYDWHGRYLFAAPGKVSVLADALVRAVGRGRDNELFVLLADLLELDEADLDPLLRAVRVAMGRHHQVVLICPWPPGLAHPIAERPGNLQSATRNPQAKHSVIWDQLTTDRFHTAYQRLRRTFTRLGVAVLCAADEPVPLILNRLERLRTVGRPHS
jgi:uncharacterized protein (DUF58 family)